MSAITHIGTVVVPVADQDEALAFYTGTLGFEVRIDGQFGPAGRWIEVAPPGAQTSIALVPRDSAPEGPEISFATRSAAGDHAGLRACGVDAGEMILMDDQGVPPMFAFRDPDGNRFRMAERE